MTHQPTPQQLDEIRKILAAGNKIEAIKLYRLATNVGLAEAKEFVEAIETGRSPSPNPLPPQLESVSQLLFAGKKIEAIKIYRQITNVGLAEAKTAVEKLESELRQRDPIRFPQSKGCLGLLLLLGGIILISGWIVQRL